MIRPAWPLRGPLPLGSRWVIVVTLVMLVVNSLAPGPIAQLPIALLFYFTCPGMLLVDWLDLPDVITRLALSTAASLAINIIVVTVIVVGGWYSPSVGLWTVAAISLVGGAASALLRAPDPAATGLERLYA
jgi:hypothetical protein